MAIQWQSFKQQLSSTFQSNRSVSGIDSSEIASFIGTQYDITVKTGNDLFYGNNLLQGNTPLLIGSVERGLTLSKKVGSSDPLVQGVKLGLTLFWQGATLAPAVPPPPSVSVVSNFVVNGGSVPDFSIPPSPSVDVFVNTLVGVMRSHLFSVSGITVGLVQTGTGAFVPIPFNWLGYI